MYLDVDVQSARGSAAVEPLDCVITLASGKHVEGQFDVERAVHRFEIDDDEIDDDLSEVYLAFGDIRYPLAGAAGSASRELPKTVRVVGIPSVSLRGNYAPTRLDPANTELPPIPAVAGMLAANSIPVNGVADRVRTAYLQPDEPLGPASDWVFGSLTELETTWEPLGWALDDWLDTISLGPHEDSMRSEATYKNQGQAVTDDTSSTYDQSRVLDETRATTAEQTSVETTADGSGRSLQFGIAQPGLTISNPLDALIKSITFGYDATYYAADVGATGDLRRSINGLAEQQAASARLRNASARADSSTFQQENRSLRALRNLTGAHTLNLARLSVVRQFKVSTSEVQQQRVLFIKGHDLDRPFSTRDVFVHNQVIRSVLLDEGLLPDLSACVAGFGKTTNRQSPPEAVETRRIERISGTCTVLDPAKGSGARVRVMARFVNRKTGNEEVETCQLDAGEPGSKITFEKSVARSLADLVGWRVEISDAGRLDKTASLSSVIVQLDVVDDLDVPSRIRVNLPGRVDLQAERPTSFGPSVRPRPLEEPAGRDETAVATLRLVAHLDAHRAHYRMAIDLLTDQVTRFLRLAEVAPNGNLPSDMKPLGVVGAHIAYLAEGPITDDPDQGARCRKPRTEAVSTFISWPTGGSFVEAVEGRATPVESTHAPRPVVIVPPEATLSWPTPITFGTPSTKSTEDKASEPPKPKPTEAGTSELLEKLEASITKQLEELQARLGPVKTEKPGEKSEKAPTTPE